MILAIAKFFGVPSWLVVAAGVLLAVGGLGIAKCSYDRSVIKAHEAKAEARQAKRERKADANLHETIGRDEAAAQQRQKEIADATRNIPDQAPSARQRARACVELRREAQQRGKPQPSC